MHTFTWQGAPLWSLGGGADWHTGDAGPHAEVYITPAASMAKYTATLPLIPILCRQHMETPGT